jgi:NAD(P)-dependent dehydrogenase (short-subunit alcohol dehydrogenase family)
MNKQHILIAGASGAVGEGITIELLQRGHRVTAVVRNEAKSASLQRAIREETTADAEIGFIVNAYRTEEEISALAAEIAASRPVDIAIASLGGWYHGDELHQIPAGDWDAVLQNGLHSHFHFIKAVVPALEGQGQGMFVMINGGAAEYAIPHSGVISVVAAAQKMMSQVLHRELAPKNIRVYGVGAYALVRTRDRANTPGLWLGPAEMAGYILDLASHQGELARTHWHPLRQPADLRIR